MNGLQAAGLERLELALHKGRQRVRRWDSLCRQRAEEPGFEPRIVGAGESVRLGVVVRPEGGVRPIGVSRARKADLRYPDAELRPGLHPIALYA